MSRRWTLQEEKEKRAELVDLYIEQNKTMKDAGKILGIVEQTVFDRLKRLNIPTCPEKKLTYCNKRLKDLKFPDFSDKLAEFTGILLGDGHISPYPGQTSICVNTDVDKEYVIYVRNLLKDLFGVDPSSYERKNSPVIYLYISSVDLIQYLKKIGLYASNKVKEQVDVPSWVKENDNYKKAFLRGLFDTDGCIYKLRFGVQMAFTNRALPLLNSAREMLIDLNYSPSKISCFKVYLTRKPDLKRYIKEIGFSNKKHFYRALKSGIIGK